MRKTLLIYLYFYFLEQNTGIFLWQGDGLVLVCGKMLTLKPSFYRK